MEDGDLMDGGDFRATVARALDGVDRRPATGGTARTKP